MLIDYKNILNFPQKKEERFSPPVQAALSSQY
jgi:hypothetical protein